MNLRCVGILKYGMTSTIYYVISDLKLLFSNVTMNRPLNSISALNDKIIFEELLAPSYEYLIDKASSKLLRFLDTIVMNITIAFILELFITICVTFILIKCFLGKLNTELNNDPLSFFLTVFCLLYKM